MSLRLLLAWLHLLALGIGLASVWARGRALRASLRDPEDASALRRAFIADAWWGVAAILWLSTGLWRLLGSTEKSTAYYLGNHAFLLKMALFLAILVLEAWAMVTLIAWRTKRAVPTPRNLGRIEVISYVECALVAAMVLAAASMARGYGSSGTMDVGRTTDVGRRSDVGGTSDARPLVAPATAAESTSVSGESAPLDGPPALPPMEPSGVETVTAEDLALLAREIRVPLDGVDPANLRSSFDERRGGGSRAHEALDFMAPRGTPIRSAARGRVLKLFRSVAGGLMVYAADSSERFILMYAHLDAYAPGLRDGAPLARGQLIGTVGSTGNANPSAPHLHFAIARSADVKRWSKGRPVDPVPVLQASASGASTAR